MSITLVPAPETDTTAAAVDLSIVIPVYNEEESLPKLYDALREVLDGMDESWEIILVDDGSQDGSYAIAQALHARDDRVRVIRFRRFRPARRRGLPRL